ncbi:arsenic resistance protein [Nitrincola tibetensis]|uniref:Arsenic resistance protein n=1 Tax=Nitrincola tibetensis TaxID=2219697 RepID=A0A364NRU6_9GAMM|nr:arsenic resistance protein [Nitrincola tibetensis]RAU19829.1 arsenic resistance protein [Nitrincola tibetensis]
MKRELLEKYQVIVYLIAIVCGLALGAFLPTQVSVLELLLWPVLVVLLYTTFTQVPLAHIRQAFADPRFIVAAVMGNFILLPVVVWGLMALAPNEPAVRLGILLVLLVPCTDWFITFTHLGGGDTKHAIAFSPVSLILQVLLLPFYLWLFLGFDVALEIAQQEMLLAFFGLILLPLLAAFLTEKWADKNARRGAIIQKLGWCPVLLLALVVFSIAATQVGLVMDSVGLLGHLLFIFIAFLVIAALMSRALAQIFRLPTGQGRVLAFSLGSRNSFVVLPLALALPSSFEVAVVVIVFQSLVELFGMAAYLWWVPKVLFRPEETIRWSP